MIVVHLLHSFATELQRRSADLLDTGLDRLSYLFQPRRAIVVHKGELVQHEVLGRLLWLIIQDARALTRCIASNLGMGLRSTVVPTISMRMAYPVDIRPMTKYSWP